MKIALLIFCVAAVAFATEEDATQQEKSKRQCGQGCQQNLPQNLPAPVNFPPQNFPAPQVAVQQPRFPFSTPGGQCCNVVHPPHCSSQVGCHARRHFECSNFCSSPNMHIIPQQQSSGNCHYIRQYPYAYCGNYAARSCDSCYSCGAGYNPQFCSLQPSCPYECRASMYRALSQSALPYSAQQPATYGAPQQPSISLTDQPSTYSLDQPSFASLQQPAITSFQQPSVTYQQPSVSYQQPSVTYQQPSVTYQQPSVTYQRPSLMALQQPTISTLPAISNLQQPSITFQQPTLTSLQQPINSFLRPSFNLQSTPAVLQPSSITVQQPTVQQPSMSVQQQYLTAQQPLSLQQPGFSIQQPSSYNLQPSLSFQQPSLATFQQPSLAAFQQPSIATLQQPSITSVPSSQYPGLLGGISLPGQVYQFQPQDGQLINGAFAIPVIDGQKHNSKFSGYQQNLPEIVPPIQDQSHKKRTAGDIAIPNEEKAHHDEKITEE